ncbi:20227_t:CDS:2, partial [Entrophospora sp. SA101]
MKVSEILKNPEDAPPKDMWSMTIDPEDSPDESEQISPGATVLHAAYSDLEKITVDRQVRHLKESNIDIPYGKILYDGLNFSSKCKFLLHSLEHIQQSVNGEVRVKLYK